MALVKSSLLSSISGSIGGTTYARSRGGTYARNRTTPINPRTVAQGVVRSMFGSLAMAYNALTSSQKTAWEQFGQAIQFINRLGDPFNPSGRSAFMQLNQNLQLVGSTTIDDPPSSTVAPVLDVSWLAVTAEVSVAEPLELKHLRILDSGPHAGDMTYQFKFSPPLIAARGQSFRNLNRGNTQFVGAMDPISDVIMPYQDTYNAVPVPATEGQVINWEVRCVDPVTGLACAYVAGNTIIGPGT